MLDLIKDGSLGVLPQEPSGVLPGESPGLQRLQTDIGLVGEGPFAKSRLSGLPRSGEGDHRVDVSPSQEDGEKVTVNHT
jgi:hypothetical protein